MRMSGCLQVDPALDGHRSAEGATAGTRVATDSRQLKDLCILIPGWTFYVKEDIGCLLILDMLVLSCFFFSLLHRRGTLLELAFRLSWTGVGMMKSMLFSLISSVVEKVESSSLLG